EQVYLGADYVPATGQLDTHPVTVRGSLTVNLRSSPNNTDVFEMGDGSVVRGSATLTEVEGVSLGAQDVTITDLPTVSGSVLVTNSSIGTGLTLNLIGKFGNNVTVKALATTNSFNSVTIEPVDPGSDTTVAGNVTVTMANALFGNVFNLNAGNN